MSRINMIKRILVVIAVLISFKVFAVSDEWLLQSTAKPLDIEFSSSVLVCTPSSGCQTVIVIGN